MVSLARPEESFTPQSTTSASFFQGVVRTRSFYTCPAGFRVVGIFTSERPRLECEEKTPDSFQLVRSLMLENGLTPREDSMKKAEISADQTRMSTVTSNSCL